MFNSWQGSDALPIKKEIVGTSIVVVDQLEICDRPPLLRFDQILMVPLVPLNKPDVFETRVPK